MEPASSTTAKKILTVQSFFHCRVKEYAIKTYCQIFVKGENCWDPMLYLPPPQNLSSGKITGKLPRLLNILATKIYIDDLLKSITYFTYDGGGWDS